jgi:hypothetical protein
MNINDPKFTPQINEQLQSFLPEHTSDELELLRENCQADPEHVVMPAIQVCPELKYCIVDGHNQFSIRKKLGLAIRYVEVSIPGGIPAALAYMLRIQLGRRNLPASQRAFFVANATKRNSHGGDRKTDQETVPSLENLAKAAGVGITTLKAAAKVVDGAATPVADAVQNGAFTVHDAANVVGLPGHVQVELAEQAKATGQTLTKTKRISEARSRSGQEIVSTKVRKEALAVLGQLWRLLGKLGIQKYCEDHLEAVEEVIKNCDKLIEEENKVPF